MMVKFVAQRRIKGDPSFAVCFSGLIPDPGAREFADVVEDMQSTVDLLKDQRNPTRMHP